VISTLVAILALGLAQGSLYALIALGYTMVYGIIELINFAHGDVFMVGAFLSLLTVQAVFGMGVTTLGGVSLVVAIVLALAVSMIGCGVLGVAIERLAYRPLRTAPRLAPLVTAIGVSFILENGMQVWQGGSTKPYPSLIPNTNLFIAGTPVNTTIIVVVVSAVILMVGLDMLVNRTRIGRAMRATAQDREAAMMMGVDVNRIIAITFFIGSALAGAAGVVYGIYIQNIDWHIGFGAGLKAFTAAVLGGIGNIRGAMLGGLAIGLLEALVSQQGSGAGIQWAEPAVFAVLIVVLVFRPTGLLGAQVVEKA
jgi:branched-chain amino acid transport system permease protein